jgi:hypothetical protein
VVRRAIGLNLSTQRQPVHEVDGLSVFRGRLERRGARGPEARQSWVARLDALLHEARDAGASTREFLVQASQLLAGQFIPSLLRGLNERRLSEATKEREQVPRVLSRPDARANRSWLPRLRKG